ncbi:bile acid beta-glucosidase [Legionella santicrucis]|uniref:Bile acid beta-glucosidase n=1 Tax=Legionella santicrucis TaxID=45074 RepID=A0A0W0Y985_9GAMM|nr:TIGR03759 family integrating conjugative element protein [Legionella santicrucis]KTD53480.1 bile acid beta-glucosidase [Legionella santicrucis]
MHKPTISLIALLITSIGHAEFAIPMLQEKHLQSSILADETLARTGLSNNDDDIYEDIQTIRLNEQQLHEAKIWGLTLDEEKRYVILMQNRSGVYYKGLRLTPLDILGINARDEAERNHFAMIAAEQEAQKVTKNIAWNNAFHKAYNNFFANVPVVGDFDPSPYSPYAHQPVTLTVGDRLYLFIKPYDSVKSILLQLIDAIEKTPNTQLHIMLIDADELAIQQWANLQQIPRQLVSQGHVSLNHGEMNFQALSIAEKATPLLILANQSDAHIVDIGRF